MDAPRSLLPRRCRRYRGRWTKNQPVEAGNGDLKTTELAARPDVKPMEVYQRIRSGLIETHYVTRHSQRHVILFCDDLDLIERLRPLEQELETLREHV